MPDNLNQEDFNSFLKRDTFRFYGNVRPFELKPYEA